MNLYVVAKPYDIDQVISNERNQDSQNDLWLVLNLDKKTPSVCLEYLSELNQKNTLILRSPIFSDLFFNKEISSRYFVRIEHNLEKEKEDSLSSIIVVAYKIIRFLYKIFSFFPAYLYWIISYYNYIYNLRSLKIETLYTQAWITKLLPLATVEFNEIVFYDGGKSSEDNNDKEVFYNEGPFHLLVRTLKDKRNFAMPFFLKEKITNTSKLDSRYANNYYPSKNSNYDNLKFKDVDKSFLLIAGSYEQINESFQDRIKVSMKKNNLNISKFNNIVYRPHPRRILSKKEKRMLQDMNFSIVPSVVSLESDLQKDRVLTNKLPGCIFIQNSSASVILKKFLPKKVILITEEV